MKIEIEMNDEQFEELEMDMAEIVWRLGTNPALQKRAIQIANLLSAEVSND